MLVRTATAVVYKCSAFQLRAFAMAWAAAGTKFKREGVGHIVKYGGRRMMAEAKRRLAG